LDHFASTRFDWNQPHAFIYTDPRGIQSSWTVERSCALAHEALSQEGIAYLKLKAIEAGMRSLGYNKLYEKLTGEVLPP
jgi:hypothetical protein